MNTNGLAIFRKPSSTALLFNMGIEQVHKALSSDERAELLVIEDPIRWAEASLRNPRNPTKHFEWRDYQRDMVSAQPTLKIDEKGNRYLADRFRVYRCGRRSGKTASMAAETLWHAFTKSDFKIIIVTPFESQVREIFRMMISMIKGSFVIPSRIVKKPYIMEFANGSSITGYTAGASSSVKGTGIRGTEADLIILDECDHGIDDVIAEVIFPIFNINKTAIMIMSSTPSGRHGLFWEVCNKPSDFGALQFHIPSTMIPGWDAKAERLSRKSARTQSKYQHEYLAEFGSLEEGVFLNKHLMKCLKKYLSKEDSDIGIIPYNKFLYDPNNLYFMGVDWNEIYGVSLIIVEKKPGSRKVRLWNKILVEKQDYTQIEAVNTIIKISNEIEFKAIYIDEGFGGTQKQMLMKYGHETLGSKLHKIVKAIPYGGNLTIRDPATNRKENRPAKAFMVDNAVYFVENVLFEMPKYEDEKNRLVGAMRGYKVKRFSSKTNEPVYECEEEDHELDALFLALLAVTMETSGVNRTRPHAAIKQVVHSFKPKFVDREMKEREGEKSTKLIHLFADQFLEMKEATRKEGFRGTSPRRKNIRAPKRKNI